MGMYWTQKGKLSGKSELDGIDDLVEQVQEHTHAPSATRCELTKVHASLKRKASTTHDTTQQNLGNLGYSR